jgi:XrtJ-associated TM-motif-TM protein
MKKTMRILPVLALCLIAVAAKAQFGGTVGSGSCDESPENPTAILALAGSTGAGLAVLRARLAARRSKNQ